eukprot:7376209-Prymnesium_polylepis.3
MSSYEYNTCHMLGEEPAAQKAWEVWSRLSILEVVRFRGRGRRIDVKVRWEGADVAGKPWKVERRLGADRSAVQGPQAR